MRYRRRPAAYQRAIARLRGSFSRICETCRGRTGGGWRQGIRCEPCERGLRQTAVDRRQVYLCKISSFDLAVCLSDCEQEHEWENPNEATGTRSLGVSLPGRRQLLQIEVLRLRAPVAEALVEFGRAGGIAPLGGEPGDFRGIARKRETQAGAAARLNSFWLNGFIWREKKTSNAQRPTFQ